MRKKGARKSPPFFDLPLLEFDFVQLGQLLRAGEGVAG
jgi:hypothetical protein